MFSQKKLIQLLGREGEGFSGQKIESHLKLWISFTFSNYGANTNRGTNLQAEFDINSKFYEHYSTINSQNCRVVLLDF